MCGIAGLVNFKTRETMTPIVGRMLDLMANRGPDASGIYQCDPVALGHPRLSIIDSTYTSTLVKRNFNNCLHTFSVGFTDPLIDRAKRPYRAPISRCFFGQGQPDYVAELLSDQHLKAFGYFDEKKVAHLVAKCGQGKGSLLSERENMALVGILSTQLIHHQFIENFSAPDSRRREHATVR